MLLILFVLLQVTLLADSSSPSGLAARSVPGQVLLTWDAAAGGAVSYRVYRSGTQIGTTAEPRYLDQEAGEATTYRYQVTAVDSLSNESVPASTTVITPDRYGASPLVKCNGNPNPVKWTISSVSRKNGVAYYRVSAVDPTSGGVAGARISNGMVLAISGLSADNGGFNNTWAAVGYSYMSANPPYFQVNQPGADVAWTPGTGTVTLLTWYPERIGNEWWFCSPLNHGMKTMGVYKITYDGGTDPWGVQNSAVIQAKYAKGPLPNVMGNWMVGVLERLRWWGFNTLDEQHYTYLNPWGKASSYWAGTPDALPPVKLPAIIPYPKTTPSIIYNRYAYAPGPVKNLIAGVNKSVFNSIRIVADYFDAAPYSTEDNFPAWVNASFSPTGNSALPRYNLDYLVGLGVDDTDDHPWASAGGDFPTIAADGGRKNNLHGGWIALVTSPLQSAAKNGGIPVVFNEQRVYTKERLMSFLSGRYGSIAALNAAWGAAYEQWDSTGKPATFPLSYEGAGAFSGVLPGNNLTPCSVHIIQSGKPVAGDDCAGNIIRRPDAQGQSGAVVGTVDYKSATVSLTLPVAEAVTAKYVNCGWGCGSGLMDEDGGKHSWIPHFETGFGGNFVWDRTPPPSAEQQANFQRDMDDFLYLYAAQYFSVIRDAGRKYYPGIPYLGLSSLGSWQTPSRAPVLKAAAEYCDVLRLNEIHQNVVDPRYGDYSARLRFILDHSGDKPWTWWSGFGSQNDSYFQGSKSSSSFDVDTQNARGLEYQSFLRTHWQPEPDGVIHTVGINWWAYYDTRTEYTNYGLVDLMDNAYDGAEPGANGGACSFPLSGYNCGIVTNGSTYWWEHACGTRDGKATDSSPMFCAEQPYGDFMGIVRQTNMLWLPREMGLVRGAARLRAKVR